MSEQINKVLASTAQSFTSDQQAQARANIGAQGALTAGTNITIVDDTISAQVPDISDLATKSELTAGLAAKQNTLTAGANISIVDNVISATGGGGVSSTAWGAYTVTVTKVLDGSGTKLWDPDTDSDWTLTESYVNCDSSTTAVTVAKVNGKLRVNIRAWAPKVLPCWSTVFVDENANFGAEMAAWGHPFGGYCQVCAGMSRVWMVKTNNWLDENGISSLTSTNKSGTLRIEFSFWFPLQQST